MSSYSIDILDQFNPSTGAKASTTQQDVTAPPSTSTAPAASGPGRPSFSAQPSSQSEADFMAQLQEEFAKTMTNLGVEPESEAKDQAQEITAMGKELDEFTRKMEKEGLQPEDLLRAILGEEGIDPSKINLDATTGDSQPATSESAKRSTSAESKGTFEETIRRTMERMQASDSSARDAQHNPSDTDEDILAQLMKAMESADPSTSGGDDTDLSNLFLNMMHQLTSKDLLYEPMRELDGKFPDWLERNKGNLKPEDQERYQTQQQVVRQIVVKFEESTYSDDNEKDRGFIWEKMQQVRSKLPV